jgi:DNA-binding IscR family transcriptional regulator
MRQLEMYAIAIIICLRDTRAKNLSKEELATILSVSTARIEQGLKPLRKAGFIASDQGTRGGYRSGDLDHLTAWDVRRALYPSPPQYNIDQLPAQCATIRGESDRATREALESAQIIPRPAGVLPFVTNPERPPRKKRTRNKDRVKSVVVHLNMEIAPGNQLTASAEALNLSVSAYCRGVLRNHMDSDKRLAMEEQ